MKLTILFLICMGVVAVNSSVATKYNMDKEMAMKQKFFFDMFHRVWEPLELRSAEEYKGFGENFIHSKDMFTKFDKDMEHFTEHYHMGLVLHRGDFFTVFNMEHLMEVKGIFKMFYYAKDWETFKHVVTWSRMHMNEGVFVYALSMVVMHHKDYKFIVLPRLHEIMPHMFYNDKFIMMANNFDFHVHNQDVKYHETHKDMMMKLREDMEAHPEEMGKTKKHMKWMHWNGADKAMSETKEMKFRFIADKKIYNDNVNRLNTDPHYASMMKDMKMYWMKYEYTDALYWMNDESKLTYFTEDIDWNLYWYYSNMRYPFWLDMEAEEFGLNDHHYGEFFLFNLQQFLARYNMERLSHHMGPFNHFSWHEPIVCGYNPHMVTTGFHGYSYRPNYYHIHDLSGYFTLHRIIEDFERRISDIIDKGVYTTASGEKIDLQKPDAIDLIGKLTWGSDKVDKYFFINWIMFSSILVSGNEFENMMNHYHVHMPHVMLNFETMARDPLFYEMYSKLIHFYYQFKHHLGPYTYEDIFFDGVKVNDVSTDKLVTYYDWIDSDITSLIDFDHMFKDGKFDWDMLFLSRRMRLNHKPFTVTYDIDSVNAGKVVVRTFLGPKFDHTGHYIPINENRKHFLFLDEFVTDLTAGNNHIKRSSLDYFWTKKDTSTFTEMYRDVMMNLDGKMDLFFEYDRVKTCGFPDHLLLPKGWYSGMPMLMYVLVTPHDSSMKEFTTEEQIYSCGSFHNDKWHYGYPLDRLINEHTFFVPNMYMKTVMIYHRENTEMDKTMMEFMPPKYIH